MEIKKIYAALAAINQQIEPIKKDQKNEFQNYKFRGIDQVYNMLQQIYSKNKVMPIPRVVNRICTSFDGRDGKKQFKVEQEMIFKLLSLEDGSFEEIGPIWGEAMDSSDKATNKSNSAAAKYAFLMSHLIPTEDMTDADSEHPEVYSNKTQPNQSTYQPKKAPTEPVKEIFYTKKFYPNDLLSNPADFVIDFGKKFKGKKLSEVPVESIDESLSYWDKHCKTSREMLTGNIRAFVVNANEYLITKGFYPPDLTDEEIK